MDQYLANEKRLAEERWKASYNQMIENQIKDGGQTAGFEKHYKALGFFTDQEIQRLTNLTKKIDGPLNPQASYYLSYGEKYKTFLTTLEKGSFEEALDALEPFAILPETALKELDKIEKKYPTEQREIDMARLGTLLYYFAPVSGIGNGSSYEYNSVMREKGPQFFEMAERLFSLGKKYPAELGSYFDEGKYEMYYNPYKKIVEQYWLKSKKKTDDDDE